MPIPATNFLYSKQVYLTRISVEDAWNYLKAINSTIEFGSHDVVVGVIDNGVIESEFDGSNEVSVHSAFANVSDSSSKVSTFYRIKTDVLNNRWDEFFNGEHGTIVAGIIGGNNYDHGAIGVAPNCRLLCIDKSTQGFKNVSSAVPHSANDSKKLKETLLWICGVGESNTHSIYKYADIINCSFGIIDLGEKLDKSIDQIVAFGRKGLGTIACVASGNENVNIISSPKSYFAARHQKTITVGALKDYILSPSTITKATESNFGPEVDVCAPGTEIISPSPTDGTLSSTENNVTTTQVTVINDDKIFVDDTSNIKVGCVIMYENGTKLETNTVIAISGLELQLLYSIPSVLAVGTKIYYSKYHSNKYLSCPVIFKSTGVSVFWIDLSDKNDVSELFKSRYFLLVSTDSTGNKKAIETYILSAEKNKTYPVKVFNSETSTYVTEYHEKIQVYVHLPFNYPISNVELVSIYGDYNFSPSGTSYSTPQVSGLAALMLSINPKLNWLEVRDVLRTTATKVDSGRVSGVGAWSNGFSDWYGYGMVDVLKAVQTANPNPDVSIGHIGFQHYDLWIRDNDTDNGTIGQSYTTNEIDSPDIITDGSNINIEIQNNTSIPSIKGGEVRCSVAFVDKTSPDLTFPDVWINDEVRTFNLGIEELNSPVTNLVAKQISIPYTNADVNAIIEKCPKNKVPYLLVHISPFDGGNDNLDITQNNNLTLKKSIFNASEFFDSSGNTPLETTAPFSETPIDFNIHAKIQTETAPFDLNDLKIKIVAYQSFSKTAETLLEAQYNNTAWNFTSPSVSGNSIDTPTAVQEDANNKPLIASITGQITLLKNYKKVEISIFIDKYLGEAKHEIRIKKPLIFNIESFFNQLGSGTIGKPKPYFFTEKDGVTNSEAFGAYVDANDNDKHKFRVTSKHTSTAEKKAIAICDGKILVQPYKNADGTDNDSLVNIVLKPYTQFENVPPVKYYIYRGIKKASLITGNVIVNDNNNTLVTSINYNIDELDKKILGIEMYDETETTESKYDDNKTIESLFYEKDLGFELWSVKAGWSIGAFNEDFGFEIMLDSIGFNPILALARCSENNIVDELYNDTYESKKLRESILNYIDPAAFFGNFYEGKMFVRESVDDIDEDTQILGFEKIKKDEVYTALLENFFTNKNKIYLDIRNELNDSIDFQGNYGTNTLWINYDNEDTVPDETSTVSHLDNKWPIYILDDLPNGNKYNTIKIALPTATDNTSPLAYISTGKKGSGIIENVKTGKSKFVDLTYDENQTYTTNYITVTTPNVDDETNTRVASYINIKYVKRFNPEQSLLESEGVILRKTSYRDLVFRPQDLIIPFNETNALKIKVFNDDYYIDTLSEYGTDYIARLGVAQDSINTYLFAVKKDLRTKNRFKMNNIAFSISSGIHTTDKNFLEFAFGSNYTVENIIVDQSPKSIVRFIDVPEAYFSNLNKTDANSEAFIIIISNQNYEALLSYLDENYASTDHVYLTFENIPSSDVQKHKIILKGVSNSGGIDYVIKELDNLNFEAMPLIVYSSKN